MTKVSNAVYTYLKSVLLMLAVILAGNQLSGQHTAINLKDQSWIHGSADCSKNNDEPIQVVRYDANTWILRQNKCTNFEAPFMYLFLGTEKALLTDTGATKEEEKFPLFKTVKGIIAKREKELGHSLDLVVLHTHNHGDHKAADAQFMGKPSTTVVGLSPEEVASFLKITAWPNENASIDLGERLLDIIPIPGHQKSSVTIYDRNTQIMLTGDTFYPGRLYVQDWTDFKASIAKLVTFAETHPVKYILGNHIEMSDTKGKDYRMGSTYHPKEQKLPLFTADLKTLHEALNKLGNTASKAVHDKFIIFPVN